MNYNDPRAVAKALSEAKLEEAQRTIVLRSLMSTPVGRALAYRWLNFYPVLHNAFTSDPYATAFNCGQQNVEKQILADVMAAAPQDYLQMIKEQEHGGPSTDSEPSSDPEPDEWQPALTGADR